MTSWVERRFVWAWIVVILLSGCQKNQPRLIDQAEIPMYPTIREIRTSTADALAFSTSDTPSAVQQFYETELIKHGWRQIGRDTEKGFEYDRTDRVEQTTGYGRVLYITTEQCTRTETCVTLLLFGRISTDQGF